MRIVVALGGNALLHRGDPPDASRQTTRLAIAAPALARLAADHEVAIVHGNGPQVGLLASENETDAQLSVPYPLADMVAESQGLIGSWIQGALSNAGLIKDVVVLVSRTLVDVHDPGFETPTKYIGGVLSENGARALAHTRGWQIARDGEVWRRVVPSPHPLKVLETERAGQLLEDGAVVIISGGGGIAVVGDGPSRRSVDAVVDKDLAAAQLAADLGAELLVILTDVEGVIRGFGTPGASLVHSTTPSQLDRLRFSAGSMGPKVEAACSFVRATGGRAVIASLDDLDMAVRGHSGTQITRD